MIKINFNVSNHLKTSIMVASLWYFSIIARIGSLGLMCTNKWLFQVNGQSSCPPCSHNFHFLPSSVYIHITRFIHHCHFYCNTTLNGTRALYRVKLSKRKFNKCFLAHYLVNNSFCRKTANVETPTLDLFRHMMRCVFPEEVNL